MTNTLELEKRVRTHFRVQERVRTVVGNANVFTAAGKRFVRDIEKTDGYGHP